MSTPLMRLSRRYSFSASHRLYSDRLSNEANVRIFGKCANPNGHGHNYGLTVTVQGPIDPLTGFVMAIPELDEIVNERVLFVYEHKYLNLDVEDYFDVVPTGENIAKKVWERLEEPLKGRIFQVIIAETSNNRFEYPEY